MKKFSVSDDAINDAGDVFVVSTDSNRISCDNTDHNYSVIVHQEAEVEIGTVFGPLLPSFTLLSYCGSNLLSTFFTSPICFPHCTNKSVYKFHILMF